MKSNEIDKLTVEKVLNTLFEQRQRPQLSLLLKNSRSIYKDLAQFEKTLRVWDLKIVSRQSNSADGTIQIAVDARLTSEINWTVKLARDLFQENLVGIIDRRAISGMNRAGHAAGARRSPLAA